MSEGSISQEEIDALLSGVDMGGLSSGGSSSGFDKAALQKFSDGMKDKLAACLSGMTSAEVSVDGPSVESCTRDQLLSKVPEDCVAVMADFSSALTGDHLFIMDPEFAKKIVALVNSEENPSLDDMALSVISEVVSQHSGAEITTLCAGGKLAGLATNPPETVMQPKAMIRMPQDSFALFTYPVKIQDSVYNLWEAVSSSVAQGMADSLNGDSSKSSSSAPAAAPSMGQASSSSSGMMGSMGMSQPSMMGTMSMGQPQMMSGMMGGMSMSGAMMGGNPPSVQSIQYPNLGVGVAASEQGNIGLIMDVFMEMTVELGRTKKTIKDILGLGEGTIIELDKLAGEPVDILVNHKPIAKGEVVVIDENFGVRVTEILPAIEHVTGTL